MNRFFEKLNHLSYPTVLFIASGITIVSILPLWLSLTGLQTRLTSKAVKIVSVVPTLKPKPTEGPIPANPPAISRVYPFVGKAGDVIVIEGKNFGNYPKNRRLSIGDVVVEDDAIIAWSDTQIEVLIPLNPKQGGNVSIRIDTYPITESLPLSFYDETAGIRLRKSGTVVSAAGISETTKATLVTQNGKREYTIEAQTGTETLPLFTLNPNEEIQSLLLTDKQGSVIPYSLNPIEFGF